MSDRPPPGSAEGRALDALVAEAREHLDARGADASARPDARADLDWSRLESRVMAAVEAERPALACDRARGGWRSRGGALRAGAVVLAAAAAVAIFAGKDRDAPLVAVPSSPGGDVAASALRATEGSGAVRVGGHVASPGEVVRAGSVIEVDGARAVFERAGKVTWLVEQDDAAKAAPGARPAVARVASAGESLVLGLEHGVVEADVVPVPAGEAFAIDVATERAVVRVAVHGTHLRVARAGDRVTVDLTSGVIAIGTPPRAGVTQGTTVTAPAHVELDATDLSTLRVDRSPGATRAPVPLGEGHALARAEVPAAPTSVAPTAPSHAARAAGARDTLPAARQEPRSSSPRDTIASAVRACAVAQSRSGEVLVTVSTTLRLRVTSAGVVESAQFSPPLLPDVQSCAAKAIYATKLDETGSVAIPIEFSY
ncbi:MAG: hypothetical protein KF850_36100 [Labilithrix sp.]|nr:hypothetical protein [Labilithrix sp.]